MGEATTLLREFGFRDASIPEKMLVIRIDPAAISRGLSDAAERFLTIEPAWDGIRPGDIVKISFPDETAEGGERQAQFAVGRHFYDPQLEDALQGLAAGQSAQLTVRGQTRPVRVLSVKRRHIPPLTDARIADLHIEGVDTVEAYRQHLIDQAVARKRAQLDRILIEYVQKQVIAQSAFSPIDREADDYRFFYDNCVNQAKQYAAQQQNATEGGMLRMMLGLKEGATDEETQAALADYCERQVKLLALGRASAQRDGVAYTLADCEAELREFAEMRGVPYETLAAAHPLESLLPGKYMEYYGQKILTHFEQRYAVAVEAGR